MNFSKIIGWDKLRGVGQARWFASSSYLLKVPKGNKLPPRPKIVESEITEVFIKGGSGAGGQKINKTNSKVQLTHIPTGLVVTSQATRSREQNRKHARDIMALKLQELLDPENCRTKVVIERRAGLKARKMKKSNRKYRELAKQEGTGEEESNNAIFIDPNLIDVEELENDNQTTKKPV